MKKNDDDCLSLILASQLATWHPFLVQTFVSQISCRASADPPVVVVGYLSQNLFGHWWVVRDLSWAIPGNQPVSRYATFHLSCVVSWADEPVLGERRRMTLVVWVPVVPGETGRTPCGVRVVPGITGGDPRTSYARSRPYGCGRI